MKKVKVVINFNVTQEDELQESAYQTLLDGREEAEEILTRQFKEHFNINGELKVTFDIKDVSHENYYSTSDIDNIH